MEYWLKYGKTEVSFELPYECNSTQIELSKASVGEISEADVLSKLDALGVNVSSAEKRVSILVDLQIVSDDFLRILTAASTWTADRFGRKNVKILLSPWRFGREVVELSNVLEKLASLDLDTIVVDKLDGSISWVEDEKIGMKLMKEYLDCDLRIVLSPVEFHGAYGVIDSRYTVLLGVMDEGSKQKSFRNLKHAWDLLSSKPEVCIHTVHDEDGKVLEVLVGRFEDIVERSQELLRSSMAVSVERKVDAIIASCGGYPMDSTLMNSIQSIGNVQNTLKDDGVLVLVAECINGLGNYRFYHEIGRYAIERDDYRPRSFLEHEAMLVNTLKRFAKKFKLAIVSTIPRTYIEKLLEARAYDTVSDAVSYITRSKGKEIDILIVPNATRTFLYTTLYTKERYECKHEYKDDEWNQELPTFR